MEASFDFEHSMVPLRYQVADRVEEFPGTVTLKVLPIDSDKTPGFLPGQFCMLYVFGVGEIPVSISGDPDDLSSYGFTIRSVGAVSDALVRLECGQVIGIRGPFGSSWPLDGAQGKDLVIFAGGIGLAPLRSLVRDVLDNRTEYNRVILLYGGRSPDLLLYQEELSEWIENSPLEVYTTVDIAPTGYRGVVGTVPRLLKRARIHPKKSIVVMCGPEIMMHFCIKELRGKGVPDNQLYLSLERNMKCALGVCGRCQFGPEFVCKDGPVFSYDRIRSFFEMREV